MKIGKRLRLNSWIYMVAVVLMALSLAWAFWSFDKNNQNEKLAEEMQKTAFERIALRDEYLLNREERASMQWQAKSETLRRLMETAVERFSSTEDKALLQKARQDFDATFSGFSAILEKDKRERLKAKRILVFDEATARQIGQIFLKGYTLMDSIGSVHESTARASIRARNISAFLIIFFFIVGGLVIVINSNLINRILVKRLATLTVGIKTIGDGNLDYLIVVDADDELSELARASNEMTYKLKQSYISVENMRQEIALRNQAEEVSKKEQDLSNAIIEAIPGTFYMLDETGQYVRWNAYQRDEIVGKPDDLVGSINALETIHADDRGLIQSKIANVLANGVDETVEGRVLLRGGPASRWLVMTGCRMMIDGRPFLVGIGIDITERKKAEIQKADALQEIKRLNEELEHRVAQRTAELTAKTVELERINKVFVDRELRMRELKARIAELEKKDYSDEEKRLQR
jgi:PAS domain S-box-containing protein